MPHDIAEIPTIESLRRHALAIRDGLDTLCNATPLNFTLRLALAEAHGLLDELDEAARHAMPMTVNG